MPSLLERAQKAANFRVLIPHTRYRNDGSIKDSTGQKDTVIHIMYDNPVTGIDENMACKQVFPVGTFDRAVVSPVLVSWLIDCPQCQAWLLKFMAAKRTKVNYFGDME